LGQAVAKAMYGFQKILRQKNTSHYGTSYLISCTKRFLTKDNSSKRSFLHFTFKKNSQFSATFPHDMEVALKLRKEEQTLIEACAKQERWAQQKLYETYYPAMIGVCMRYVGNADDARDVLHEGFIKVFRNIAKYQPGTSLKAWIHRIMVNASIDYYRKQQRRRTEDIEEAYGLSSKDTDAVSRCSEQEILAAVQKLSPVYRTVFNLYVIEGYPHKDIAKMLGITESTSRSNLLKARVKLQNMLATGFRDT